MKSIFEVIGPVMIGPSSSHTAGAVRLGRVARSVIDEQPVKAEITLHGSFAETYKGHGTDRALVGGLLGMDTDDSDIKDALTIATEAGLTIKFKLATDILHQKTDIHPNTATIKLKGISGKIINVEGSSVGGGNIIINKINEFEVEIKGTYPTMVVEHADKPGVIGGLTSVLGENGINIAAIKMSRKYKGANNLMIIEADQDIPDEVVTKINQNPEIISAIKIEPI